MINKIKETLSQQVYRLLGKGCAHEWPYLKQDTSQASCLHCRDLFHIGFIRKHRNPPYTTSLDSAWKCVVYCWNNGISCESLMGMSLFDLIYNDGEEPNPALTICKVFVGAMGEEPASIE